MNKKILIAIIAILAISIAGILLVDLAEDEAAIGKLYTYPVSVGEKTYVITVRTNWTSAPEVYLPEFSSNYVSVDFRGPERVTFFFNVTIPADLIWGEISVIGK